MVNPRGRVTLSIGFILAIFLSGAATRTSLAANTIYVYTDDSGTRTYTTELHSIPERYRSQLVEFDFGSTAPASPPPSPPSPTVHPPSPADVRIVQAEGEFRMGYYDTRADGIKLAVEAAKRQALEQVATYLESITEVRNMDVTRDDIRSFTAGVVTVLDQEISTIVEGDTIVIRANLTAEVDADEVSRAIAALRANEDARTELAALQAETDTLHRQLDAANLALATVQSPEEAEVLNQQRQDTINQLQGNAYIAQAWTNWAYAGPGVYAYPWYGVRSVRGLLLQAGRFHPVSPRLHRLREIAALHSSPPQVSAPLAGQPRGSLLLPPRIVAPPPFPIAGSVPRSPGFKQNGPGTQAPNRGSFLTRPPLSGRPLAAPRSVQPAIPHMPAQGNFLHTGRMGGSHSGLASSGGHTRGGGRSGGGGRR